MERELEMEYHSITASCSEGGLGPPSLVATRLGNLAQRGGPEPSLLGRS